MAVKTERLKDFTSNFNNRKKVKIKDHSTPVPTVHYSQGRWGSVSTGSVT